MDPTLNDETNSLDSSPLIVQPIGKSEDKIKRGKKSIALAALNKNVLIWAGFFSVSLIVYSLMSGGDFSFLMTYCAMSRMF